jgi:methyltransferase (TIGR00027 family)
MTCLSRAISVFENNNCYKGDDYIAPMLLPGGMKPFLHIGVVRRLFANVIAPKGIYEYVISRTKYIDEIYKRALAERFGQILIFGAGFDTRAIRMKDANENTKVFELDVPVTQQAKIRQYQNRKITSPKDLHYIAIDFDKESLPNKLDEAGFDKHQRSLFILEGLVMYLQPKSVDETFSIIQNYASKGSWIVFDFVYASVLRREGLCYGEEGISRMVSGAGEQWHFGIEKGEIEQFLQKYNMKLVDQKDSKSLEKEYFTNENEKVMGRINGTHCIVTAEKV